MSATERIASKEWCRDWIVSRGVDIRKQCNGAVLTRPPPPAPKS